MTTKKLNNDIFIKRSKEIHGDTYDYSKVEYVNSKTHVVIVCDVHGDFTKTPSKHMSGQGCPVCARIKDGTSKSIGHDEFIKRANIVHSNFYDYSKTVYVNMNSYITIVCPVHGDFQHTPSNHLGGSGCRKCRYEKLSDLKRYTTSDFIEKAKIVHSDYYKYNGVEYIDSYTAVRIKCPEHGVFYQMPYVHLSGSGCIKCSAHKSNEEDIIRKYINELGFDTCERYRPKWMKGLELDIYVPDKKLAIEYCGSVFHHSSKGPHLGNFLNATSKKKSYHYDKWKLCRSNGVRLITIYDFKWFQNQHKYKQLIRHALGLSHRVFARKCNIVNVPDSTAYQFHKDNHLESFHIPYKDAFSYGLMYEDKLLMVATVGDIYDQTSKQYKKKLQRISTMSDYAIVGGLTKLSNHIVRNHGTFIYQTTNDTGSVFESISSKDTLRYWWVNRSRCKKYYSRNFCQKHLLKKHFKEDVRETDTESSYMERLGYIKVYDSGLSTIKVT